MPEFSDVQRMTPAFARAAGRRTPTAQAAGGVYDQAAQQAARQAMLRRVSTPVTTQSAAGPAVQRMPAPVVQRTVSQKLNGKWMSDLDPSEEFDTQMAAQAYETGMQPPDPITGGRAPTLYTYMATKSHRKMSGRGIPQGPHTMGFTAVHTALNNTEGNIALEHLIPEQVITPSTWRQQVQHEFGSKPVFDGKSETSLRVLRAYRAYNGLWQELQRVVNGTSQEQPRDLIDELIQLNPYTTYHWTKPETTKKKHLKNKGENSNLSDPKNIDLNARFKDRAQYMEMVQDRLDMLDDDYVPGQSDSESDSDSEDSSDMDF